MEKKITLWAARDKFADGGGDVWLFTEKPHYEKDGEDYLFCADGDCENVSCFGDAFEDITFENSPVEVELTIKVKE